MTQIRDTSLKAYDEIKEEDIYDNDMEMVLDAIRNASLMTAREICTHVLGYEDMNKVRPRIRDLKRLGYILEVGKRECSLSGRTAYVWATLEGIEKYCLKKVGFIEKEPNLFYFIEEDVTLYQDFRKGKRTSYAFTEHNNELDHRTLECHKKFKAMLKEYLKEKQEG